MILDIIFWLGVYTAWGALMYVFLVEQTELDKPVETELDNPKEDVL